MHSKNTITAGKPIADASKVLIMLHGRGASAKDILQLATHLNVVDFALLAPQATNNSWYPFSFLAPLQQNEPGLSSALDVIRQIVEEIKSNGITSNNIYFAGFSQGACLVLEYIARHPDHYGGVAAFTGGLIGEELQSDNYQGDLHSTPIFIGTGNPDSHVPLERVHQSVGILKHLNGDVTLKVYDGRPHTISPDEVALANELIFK